MSPEDRRASLKILADVIAACTIFTDRAHPASATFLLHKASRDRFQTV
jgi:hypothetical protein